MKRITVLLADDNAFIRQGLRRLLEAELDIKVIGEAKSGRQAVKMATALRPDVVSMGIEMSLLYGLKTTRQILRALPTSKLLILSAYDDAAYVQQSINTGVAGYVLIHTCAEDLAKGIREVHSGKPFFSAAIAKFIRKQRRCKLLVLEDAAT